MRKMSDLCCRWSGEGRAFAIHFVHCCRNSASLCVATRFAHCFAFVKPVSLRSARRSQGEITEKTGVALSTLGRLESGDSNFRVGTLEGDVKRAELETDELDYKAGRADRCPGQGMAEALNFSERYGTDAPRGDQHHAHHRYECG